MMRAFATAILLIAGLQVSPIWAQTTCKTGKDKTPHQQALWIDEFPNQVNVEGLCEGSVSIDLHGDICISGRVTYKQLAAAIGKPIRAPAADTISVQGHLISGSGNVVLGPEVNFVYDFVKSYTVGGVTVSAGTETANALLAASNGLIDGVCFDKTFSKEPELYAITHDLWLPGNADENKLVSASIIYASCYTIVAEYHTPSTNGPWFGTILNSVTTFFASITPSFIFKYLPLLGATGIFRFFVVGTVSTSQWPQPLRAPDVIVENVQIDTEWSTLIDAIADGLFTTDIVPTYFGVLIKRVEPLTGKSCWPVTAAAIDIQAPLGSGDALDKYVRETVMPYLQARGRVGLHLGKRIESGSTTLEAAMNTYKDQCGVTLNLEPQACYHPLCRRSTITTNFTYPSEYYQVGKDKKGLFSKG